MLKDRKQGEQRDLIEKVYNRKEERTLLDDAGFSLWTFSNSFFSLPSNALSSAPW